ncbi:MAG: hypothetical protein ILA11_11150 [Butyrivibrio sp.]|nr:hypothetical protein [Butyrivibrio sp.]
MDVRGIDVCPWGNDFGKVYGVSWCAVDTSGRRWFHCHQFDSQDWKEFWKMRDSIIKERLFHR